MRNIKLIIEYDGTGYHGWQSQINATAVQDVVGSAIKKLTGEEITLTGSSRTDTGVHALGQVANFLTASRIPEDKFAYALNSMLPEDIVIRKSEEADTDFHSRYSAKGKRYRYLFFSSPFPSALLRYRAWHVKNRLNIDAMSAGAKHFLGIHDFKAFMATGSSVKSTVRTVSSISIGIHGDGSSVFNEQIQENRPSACPTLVLEIAGDGFLYNMVRIIAGTLVQVGCGKIKQEDIPGVIEGGDRKKAGKTAPAHGLYLMEVYY
ncbi:MAG: tRNA pseudouridine(38-40) synthase TruA [Clostridiales bacterium GWC2_40_7]|nr:MAG: tRNA pseudouridine(38-40) synthase TruA [Clostridiales bacterium GWC2_40_7]